MKLYQRFFEYIDRFFKYIGVSTKDIDDLTHNDKKQESASSCFPTFCKEDISSFIYM